MCCQEKWYQCVSKKPLGLHIFVDLPAKACRAMACTCIKTTNNYNTSCNFV